MQSALVPILFGSKLFPQAYAGWDFTRGIYRIGNQQTRTISALPGYNFTRALAAYAEDTAGNLIQFASGVPRITNKGVLIEESRTNLLLRSGDLTNAAWVTANNATKSVSSSTPPAEGVATLIDFSTATAFPVVAQYATGTAGVAYKWSVWLWATGSDIGKTISLDGQSVSEPNNGRVSLTLTSVPTRYSITFTPTTTTVAPRIIKYNSGGSQDTANSAIAWGAQLEAGSFPTSYIPTTSASVTRPADVFYYSGLSGLSPSAVTVAASGAFTFVPTTQVAFAQLDAGSNGNRITVQSDIGGNFAHVVAAAGLTQAIITSYPIVANQLASPVVQLSVGSAKGAVRGLLTGSGAVATQPTSLSVLNVGSISGGSGQPNSYIQRLAIYPFAASDAQLQSISSGNF